MELRWFEKLDGTKELQYRFLYDFKPDRLGGLSGFAHFNCTEWRKVDSFKEQEKSIK